MVGAYLVIKKVNQLKSSMSYNQLNLSRKKLFSFEFNGTLVKFYEIKENDYAETLEMISIF